MSLSFQERFKERMSSMGKQGELFMSGTSPINKSAAPVFTFARPGPSQTLPFPSLPAKDSAESSVFARPIRITRPQPDETLRMTPVTVAVTVSRPEEYKKSDLHTSKASLETTPVRPAKPSEPDSELTAPKPPVKPKRAPKQPQSAHTVANAEPKSAISLPEKAESARSPSSQQLSSTEYHPYTLKDYRSIRSNKYLELGGLGASMVGSEEWERKKELSDRRKHYARTVLQANANRIAIALSKPRTDLPDPPAADSRSRAMEFSKRIKPPAGRLRSFEPAVDNYMPVEELETEQNRFQGYLEELKARLMS